MIQPDMRFLLDTCAVLYVMFREQRLAGAADIMRHGRVSFSSLTSHEIAIKTAAGKFPFNATPGQINQAMLQTGFSLLPVDAEDADIMARIPVHHRDPFDRMLIAQAMRHGMTLITSDRLFERYGVPVLLL